MNDYGKLTNEEALQFIIDSCKAQNSKIDKILQMMGTEFLYAGLNKFKAENDAIIRLCELLICDLKYYGSRNKIIEDVIVNSNETIKAHTKIILEVL